jgi:hypothetical protein
MIEIFAFINSIVGCIEYVDKNNQIQSLYFLIPPMCFFLSSETKM